MSRPYEPGVVLGVPVGDLDLAGFVDLALQGIGAGKRSLFTTANAHSLVVAQRLPALMAHFQAADVVLPDGVLPTWTLRLRGHPRASRVAGPDFADGLLAAAAREGLGVFFMGATEETLAQLKKNALCRWPTLRIVGLAAPPFGEIPEETSLALVDTVNSSRASILFVGMTAPRQELWLSRYWPALRVPLGIGIGAAFDYLAGTKKRAPHWLGQAGGEWLFRLAREPRRLWRRNLDSFVFAWLVAKESLFRRRASRTSKSPRSSD